MFNHAWLSDVARCCAGNRGFFWRFQATSLRKYNRKKKKKKKKKRHKNLKVVELKYSTHKKGHFLGLGGKYFAKMTVVISTHYQLPKSHKKSCFLCAYIRGCCFQPRCSWPVFFADFLIPCPLLLFLHTLHSSSFTTQPFMNSITLYEYLSSYPTWEVIHIGFEVKNWNKLMKKKKRKAADTWKSFLGKWQIMWRMKNKFL